MLQPHLLKETSTPIIPCFSLNLPKLRSLKIGEYYLVSQPRTGFIFDIIPFFFKKVWIAIKNIASEGYFFTKHEKLQLHNNYDLDLNSVELLANEAGYTQYMQETQATFLKKSKYDCYEDNSMYFTNCISEFYAKQLKCNLPWAIKSNPDFKQCESEEELKQFRKLSVDITLSNYTGKIQANGCFKPNCLQTTWTKKE